MPGKSFEVTVSGGQLACFALGEASGEAPPVIAVHGITGNSHSWIAVARALGARARMLAVDLRGRGDSRALAGPCGLDAHVADLLAVLDALGLERAVFAGHSMGAYVVARLAADHRERASAAVLVDGGLRIPGSEGAEPQAFLEAFLGRTLARLQMCFETPESYYDWWRAHPAIASTDVATADLIAYAEHDLTGEPPELRSSVAEDAVRADAADLFEHPEEAERLTAPAVLLCAPLGLQGEPPPMQPLELVQAWAARSPSLRRAVQVPGTNHYTITLGRGGAAAVAAEIATMVERLG